MRRQFNDLIREHGKTLELYVPIVARVHGGSHPEFHEVHQLFDLMKKGVEEGTDLSEVFEGLREVTKNYAVPSDTCESYEAVYKMLEELDQSYRL